MPLSGEAIRMMNYIDDISTTLRRILALAPTLSADEAIKQAVDLVKKIGTDRVRELCDVIDCVSQ